jgi:hypothetical protein
MSFSVGQFWYWKFDWKISGRQPQLRWWSPWPPDLKFGRPGHHFSRQNWALLSLKFNPYMYLQLLLTFFFSEKAFIFILCWKRGLLDPHCHDYKSTEKQYPVYFPAKLPFGQIVSKTIVMWKMYERRISYHTSFLYQPYFCKEIIFLKNIKFFFYHYFIFILLLKYICLFFIQKQQLFFSIIGIAALLINSNWENSNEDCRRQK